MSNRKSECKGNYNFDRVAYFAKRRFIYGNDTIVLLAELIAAAKSEGEKDEVALVSSLKLEGDKIKDLQVRCRYGSQCRTKCCIKKLKKLIVQELEKSSD